MGSLVQDRLDLSREVQRKSLHILTSIIPLAYYFYEPVTREQIIVLCVFLTSGFLFVDLLRFFSGVIRSYFFRIFSRLLRHPEFNRNLTGATYLFIGLSLAVILFPREVAVPAMLFITLADPFAALAGKTMPLKIIGTKSVGGFVAFFLVATVCVLVVTEFGLPGVVVAFIAAVVEFMPLKLNDNVTIPLVAGYSFLLSQMI